MAKRLTSEREPAPRDVVVRSHMRPVNEENVQRLMESIQRVGLHQAITVYRDGEQLILVSGRHRLVALERLGFQNIPRLHIVDRDDLINELAGIDENLIRRNLDAAQEALALVRRKQLVLEFEARSAPARAEALSLQARRGKGEKTGPTPGSDGHTAAKAGMKPDTVRRRRKAVEALGKETLERVAGTSLAKPVELRALAALPEPERAEVIQKALAGEKVSARTEEIDISRVQLFKLREAWARATPSVRRTFLSEALGLASPEDRAVFMEIALAAS